MRSTFPTREQLNVMTLRKLQSLDIMEKDEEDLVQEIVNFKMQFMPMDAKIFRGDIMAMDILTKEQEDAAQAIIDERIRKVREAGRPKAVEPTVAPEPTPVTPEPAPEVPPVVAPRVEPAVVEPAPAPEPPEPVTKLVQKKQFCAFCDSRGVRHKKNCPTLAVEK